MLISRLFRPDARRSLADIFRINVIASPSQSPSPLITIGSTTFFHTRHNNLWLVSVTKNVRSFLACDFRTICSSRIRWTRTECQRAARV